MPIDLYGLPAGPTTRSVLLAAKALGIDLNMKFTNLFEGEHLKPEFLKINPQHTVPTLDDNGFYLWESRAIITYLAEKYGKDDSLYPKDPQKRALVNQRLYFDATTIYQRLLDLYVPQIFANIAPTEEKYKKLDEAFEFLNGFLSKSEFVAGDKVTLADIALIATVTTAQVRKIDTTKYPNVDKWVSKCKQVLPGYQEANEEGLKAFRQLYESRTKK